MIVICCAIALLLLLLFQPYASRAYRLNRWYRSLRLKQHAAVFQEMYRDIDGFSLSRHARIHQDAMEYTYGEIDFVPFIALIAMTHPHSNTQFYDLGSGCGKAIIACAMVFDMQGYYGIELFKELHQAAVIQQQRLKQLPDYQHKTPLIHFIHQDFLNTPLRSASLIFINATALFGLTWEKLNQHLIDETVSGTIIITTSKPLVSSVRFLLKTTTRVNMSWGVVTAYIQEKL